MKWEIVEGVDIMVVWELIGGVYFGIFKGVFEMEIKEKWGVNIMVYFELEIDCIVKVGFEIV